MSTPVFAVLNDLSLYSPKYPFQGTKHEARNWIASFYSLLKQAQDAGVNGLRTYTSFDEIHLVEGYTLREWSDDEGVPLDLRTRIREIFTMLSEGEAFPENQHGNPLIDCKHHERIAYGLWGAIYLESFSISLLTDSIWDTHELVASIDEMDEETLDIDTREESIRHLAQDAHLTLHKEWLTEQTRIVIPNGNTLWINRKRLFPSLSFCKNTKEQVRNLSGLHLRQVIKRLAELEKACRQWQDGRPFDMKTLPHCTPESEATLKTYKAEHSFECEDGEIREFSLHTRYTPGAGRIFFRPAENRHILYVGHVGKKLPNVSY